MRHRRRRRSIPPRLNLGKLFLVSLLFASCGSRLRRNPEDAFQEAEQLLRGGEFQQALKLADREIASGRGQPQSVLSCKLRLLKSELLQSLGDNRGAAILREAAIPNGYGYSEVTARQRLDQGWERYRASDYASAKSLLDQAATIAGSNHHVDLLALIEQRRGTVLLAIGRRNEAEASYRTSLRLANEAGDAYLRASALGNLGFLAMGSSHYDEAIGWLEQAISESNNSPSKSFAAMAQQDLGWCYYSLGDVDRALALFQNSEYLWQEMGDVADEQMAIGNIGNVYYARGDFHAASIEYGRALQIARRVNNKDWTAKWLNHLTTTALDAGDVTGAQVYHAQAVKMLKYAREAAARLWPMINEARIHQIKNEFAEAESLFSQAAQAGVDDPAPRLEAKARLAGLFASQGRLAEADAQYRDALSLVDDSRAKLQRDDSKLTYFSSLIHLQRDYVEFQFVAGREEEALLTAESSRARLLSEKLAGEVESVPASSVAMWQRVARDSKTVLLSYWLAPKRSLLWMISASGVRSFSLPPEPEIRRLVAAYRGAILGLRDTLDQEGSPGKQLYDVLVGPVQSGIPAGSRVAIVPDGALHDLNFETLIAGGDRPHYWIEDVTVSVLPSLRAIVDRKPVQRRGAELLLIGDPNPVEGGLFPKLANAGREIADIRKQFAGSAIVELTKEAAQPSAYRDAHPERFSIIHFAAHATANRESPLDSAVVLTASGDVYKLYAREIIHQPIHADLVTISACRSAGARTYGGEGLVGFAWAFLKAGARKVVAGLWEVDDDSTAKIMNLMYRGIHDGGTPAGSLRAAKLSLLHSAGAVRKPYYWAPFETFTGSLP
ncbi:MAG: CHAT domain-containing protein [Bryobacteraceae bacterium]